MDGTALCAIVPRAGHLAGAAAAGSRRSSSSTTMRFRSCRPSPRWRTCILVPAIGWASFDRALDRRMHAPAAEAPRLTRFVQHRAVRVVPCWRWPSPSRGRRWRRVRTYRVHGRDDRAGERRARPALWAFVFGVLLMRPDDFGTGCWCCWSAACFQCRAIATHSRSSARARIPGDRSAVYRATGRERARAGCVTDPVETISHSVFLLLRPHSTVAQVLGGELPASAACRAGIPQRRGPRRRYGGPPPADRPAAALRASGRR